VLVAGDDYYASLAVVRGLRAGGYEPWFATHEAATFAARSRATAGTFTLPRPAGGNDAYVAALVEAARECGAAVVLAGNDLPLKALAGRDGDFPPGTVLSAPAREVVERTTDKAVLATLAGEAGLQAPPTVELSHADLGACREGLTFPAVAKPASTAVGERDRTWLAPPARLVEDVSALEQLLATSPRWLVQPYVEGVLTAVAGVVCDGKLACSVHQAALRVYPPRVGVSAYAETIPADPALDSALTEILRRLGWSGIFQFQLIRDGRAAHVIDLNPRPYGSIALAIGAGANLPTIWVDCLLGREPSSGAYRTGTYFRAELRDTRALVGALKQRRVSEALSIARPRRRTVHAIFSVRDPAPLLALLERASARS
jgi:predicted ATP-grasp superfamily ATP-dependent carboligase